MHQCHGLCIDLLPQRVFHQMNYSILMIYLVSWISFPSARHLDLVTIQDLSTTNDLFCCFMHLPKEWRTKTRFDFIHYSIVVLIMGSQREIQALCFTWWCVTCPLSSFIDSSVTCCLLVETLIIMQWLEEFNTISCPSVWFYLAYTWISFASWILMKAILWWFHQAAIILID